MPRLLLAIVASLLLLPTATAGAAGPALRVDQTAVVVQPTVFSWCLDTPACDTDWVIRADRCQRHSRGEVRCSYRLRSDLPGAQCTGAIRLRPLVGGKTVRVDASRPPRCRGGMRQARPHSFVRDIPQVTGLTAFLAASPEAPRLCEVTPWCESYSVEQGDCTPETPATAVCSFNLNAAYVAEEPHWCEVKLRVGLAPEGAPIVLGPAFAEPDACEGEGLRDGLAPEIARLADT